MRLFVPRLAVALSLAMLLTPAPAVLAATESAGPGQVRLECDGNQPGSTCTMVATSRPPGPRHVTEFVMTARSGEHVWARDTVHSRDGRARSRPFVLPAEKVTADVSVTKLRDKRVGTPLRLMAWNLFVGGTINGQEKTGENLKQLIEYIDEVDPDVLFVVEGYGSGQKILDGLNAGRPTGERFSGAQLTRPEDYSVNGDNLWLYTKLDIEQVYPRYADADITSFNLGGARLGLPDGRHVHAFSMWTWHDLSANWDGHEAAVQNLYGLPRTKTDEQLLQDDHYRRVAMGKAILDKALPSFIGDDDAPVLMGGDLNAWPHLDWTEQFKNARGHAGMVLPWPMTSLFTAAGFVDTFRYANPDAGRHPGRTWSPLSGYRSAPARIDYIFTRGKDVRVLGSRIDDRRLPAHQGSTLDRTYPFYSDHSAVVTDVLIRGAGTGPDRQVVADEPENTPGVWPATPAGTRVPPAELSATATTFKPGAGDPSRAVDGDLTTDYHSDYPEIAPQPHYITVDLGRVRTLSAVRFQPKLRYDMNGTVLKGMVQVGDDGTTFRDVKQVEWPRMTAPNDVGMDGVTARYVRLRVDHGMGGASALAEIIPYELTS
ncbi:endonuclease/exonuclease/phosphatase family protein [Nonomuraea gerenzanensis]|uniref:Endonuclease/exonuclease/phosphatase family (38.1 kD) (5F605) n=1 Tax=Nonomuraea gerenzanensis TaxID=93944 RepID=A0A1M4E6P6_9ACTN|nr:endonuclease/exonuclease/phosphatase family protein [Nonomuraea gerenzanensis]UBU16581.1 endonuclease/exonuclease/phosphatase family protein [Nonomuraea gerenzanensis]SBO94408.1 endonuclease/exonuclease/phosphatase family precursor (38.1 kD) (5F605) [Nonomuraea gerenzanensis]